MSGIREHIRLVEGVPSQHFASMLKSRVAAAFAEELAAASAATDKMVAGWKDHSARGFHFRPVALMSRSTARPST